MWKQVCLFSQMTLLNFCPQIKNTLIHIDKFHMPLTLRDTIHPDSKSLSSPYISNSSITLFIDRL